MQTSAPRPGATSAQLKDDIDTGRTGDKVAGLDPAAAPLGTDEEAGGTPHDPQLIARTRAQELADRPANPAPNAATPALAPDARAPGSARAMPFLIGAGAAAALAVVLLALIAFL